MMGSNNPGGAGGGGGMAPGTGAGGSDGRHDDEAVLTEFLSSLMDYNPTIPDELVEHYLGRSGFHCPDLRLTRLVAVAAQKFISDIASDSLQYVNPQPHQFAFSPQCISSVGALQSQGCSTCQR
ncbi:transcription initiation factor TFIID subunit 10 isoform X2 [Aegilops tauschii subsp. strangulata]|uniref:transcription initiation factor TFIID subunit 10 isoform X2 n=1 Tax=Aegilops tauschii subsp. strangulata TaxID=200361 RepID=UPI003CC8E117